MSSWNGLIAHLKASVKVKRRRVHMKSHGDCFLGSEAVDVVADHLSHVKGLEGVCTVHVLQIHSYTQNTCIHGDYFDITCSRNAVVFQSRIYSIHILFFISNLGLLSTILSASLQVLLCQEKR